jgi:hypothetical protein
MLKEEEDDYDLLVYCVNEGAKVISVKTLQFASKVFSGITNRNMLPM